MFIQSVSNTDHLLRFDRLTLFFALESSALMIVASAANRT